MKHIGKIAALGMTVALALALSACGGNASSSAASSAAASSASASAASASATSATASSAAASSAATSSAAASSATENGTIYTNDAFAIEFALPEGWKFAKAEELGSMNKAIASMSSDASVDMIAVNNASTSLVVVAIETANQNTAGLTPQQYLDKEVEQLSASTQSGTLNYEAQDATITFKGQSREVPAKVINMSSGDTKLSIVEAAIEKEGNFMTIFAMGVDEASATAAIENFVSTGN